MGNIKYSYQTNMWGLMVQYPKLNEWDEWYAKDINNGVYYLDWDKILKYHSALGYTGIEIMMNMPRYIREFFGTPQKFTEFLNEYGIEKVTGTFQIAIGSQDKRKHGEIFEKLKKMVDFSAELGANNMNMMPCGGYYGVGPLSQEGISNAAAFANRIGRYAREKGVDIAIHSEFWGAVNYNELEAFMDQTDPEAVCFCLDTAQVSIMGFDMTELYGRWHDRIKYLHLKDTKYANAPDELRYKAGTEFADDGTRWFWEMGMGSLDFIALWKMLKKYRFEGWATIETDGTPDPLATAANAKFYLDKYLKPIYE